MDKGPELLGEVLSRLFAARGWGRRQRRHNGGRIKTAPIAYAVRSAGHGEETY